MHTKALFQERILNKIKLKLFALYRLMRTIYIVLITFICLYYSPFFQSLEDETGTLYIIDTPFFKKDILIPK